MKLNNVLSVIGSMQGFMGLDLLNTLYEAAGLCDFVYPLTRKKV